ncbi:unnamed protein product [Cyclocybe aegerita]|uniref:Transmembrane protein n=1 Tax=Cyclocybe aegerita TaxID=1973307 RepID=A0A8S0WLB1_CYCAE|nr:unnamed protein product [Cyclocybe aegerita]
MLPLVTRLSEQPPFPQPTTTVVVPVAEGPSSSSTMMLVQLPAMDTVPGLDSLPVLTLPSRLHALATPSIWLTLLVTLVILSSVRAALLFLRRPSPAVRKGGVSFIPGVGVVQVQQLDSKAPITTTASSSATSTVPSSGSSTTEKQQEEKKTVSWYWGLVKWDSLPLPSFPRARTGAPSSPSMSEAGRGRWGSPQQYQHISQGRRPGPAFETPLPALYQSEVPVSMAKMIMSRHTFRRPTSRPPPVRSTNAPQYQKRPSMV